MSHERWRGDPIELSEPCCAVPTRQPFVLLDAEREFLAHAFTLTADGRLPPILGGFRPLQEVRGRPASPRCTC